ncbi:hypothetical protein GCM10009602_15540 [Nocardiopsis tropica]
MTSGCTLGSGRRADMASFRPRHHSDDAVRSVDATMDRTPHARTSDGITRFYEQAGDSTRGRGESDAGRCGRDRPRPGHGHRRKSVRAPTKAPGAPVPVPLWSPQQ